MAEYPRHFIKALIVRWVDDHQPGFVECRFRDAAGREWTFVEKLPVVTNAKLTAISEYPQRGQIACRKVSRREEAGRAFLTISTDPWHIEATDGTDTFEVFPNQLGSFPR